MASLDTDHPIGHLIDALVDYQVEPDDPNRSVPNPARKTVEKEIHTALVHLKKLRQSYGATAIDYVQGRTRTVVRFEVAEEIIRKKIDKTTIASRNSRSDVNLFLLACRLQMPERAKRR